MDVINRFKEKLKEIGFSDQTLEECITHDLEVGEWFKEANEIPIRNPKSNLDKLQIHEIRKLIFKTTFERYLNYFNGNLLDFLFSIPSPIEVYWIMKFISMHALSAYQLILKSEPDNLQLEYPIMMPPTMGEFIITSQKQIGPYRVDFLLEMKSKNERTLSLIIECDGHDYHERTKEQASKDKERDRELKKLGYDVFRYTGRDIHKADFNIESDVMKYFENKVIEFGEFQT